MNVINQPSQRILNDLGGIQILVPNKKYRQNRYVVEERLEDRIILYNAFTKALIDINEEEYNNCINLTRNLDYVDFFFRNYFVVPDDYDETEALRNIMEKKKIQVDENYLKNIRLYTILPTTGCNARCFYCYEKGTKTKVMTKEMAEKIATLIVRRYKDSVVQGAFKNNEGVSFHWFGGEPTMNPAIIDDICKILEANDVPYNGDMISNGYLFNEELSKKAKNLWKLNSVQITIDGTEEVYNKTKAYVYKDDPNPFKTVIGNIRSLISNGIRVSIRINMDLYNADDVKNLIPQIYNEFGPERLLTVYAYPIFEGHGVKRTKEHLEKTIDKLEEINSILEEYNYIAPIFEDSIPSHHCMSDGGTAIMFTPEGYIGLCEHYIDREFIGHIDDPDNLDIEVVKKFTEREKDLDICSDCLDYTNCIRLSMCEDLRVCNEGLKRWRNDIVKRKVRVRVKRYYEEINNKRNCKSQLENDIEELKGSLRILHNKIDAIYNLLAGNKE